MREIRKQHETTAKVTTEIRDHTDKQEMSLSPAEGRGGECCVFQRETQEDSTDSWPTHSNKCVPTDVYSAYGGPLMETCVVCSIYRL